MWRALCCVAVMVLGLLHWAEGNPDPNFCMRPANMDLCYPHRHRVKRFLRFGRALTDDHFLRFGKSNMVDKRFLRFGRSDVINPDIENALLLALADAQAEEEEAPVYLRRKRSVQEDPKMAETAAAQELTSQVADSSSEHSEVVKREAEIPSAHAENEKRFMRFGRGASDDDGSVDKRFMRFGKRFMRFGRDSDDTEKRFMRFGKRFMRFGRNPQDMAEGEEGVFDDDDVDQEKRFMRFGKRFMRFGRGGAQEGEGMQDDKRFMRFGKRFMRFGRQPSENEERFIQFGDGDDSINNDGIISDDKRFMRFGKRFMRFGRDNNIDNDKRFMRFGKRFMRFGRSSGDHMEPEKRFMRFGKRFGKSGEELAKVDKSEQDS